MKDQDNIPVILGNPYLYIFGGPGPDTTLVIARGFKNDKVLCFDVYCERDMELDPGQLFRRKKTLWTGQEMRKVLDFGGNLAFMLNHNAKIEI